MSHHIYRTDAIIIGSRGTGEADKWIVLFTREHGLLWAKATSIRKGTSKLRFALGDYSVARVDLIEGRAGWKITTALPVPSLINRLDSDQRILFVGLCALVLRLCRGEEQNEKLYELLIASSSHIASTEKSDLKLLEVYYVLRILSYLGYWDNDDTSKIVFEQEWGNEVRDLINSSRIPFVWRINEALKETHL